MNNETITTIYFDMDGTLVDLFGVEGWLESLRNYQAYPYKAAKPLLNLNSLARILHSLQKDGFRIGIISWLSKDSNNAFYDEVVKKTKENWLKTHLKSVNFDEIHIVSYGTPKHSFCNNPQNDILFDDDIFNRLAWKGTAYAQDNILETLKSLKGGD